MTKLKQKPLSTAVFYVRDAEKTCGNRCCLFAVAAAKLSCLYSHFMQIDFVILTHTTGEAIRIVFVGVSNEYSLIADSQIPP